MPQVWEGKKYTLAESTNTENYFKELGVGFFARKFRNLVAPSIEVKKDGDEYTMTVSRLFGKDEKRFKSGEPFSETAYDGSTVQSTITVNGNKFTHEVGSNPPQLVVEEFGEKELNATMKVKDVSSTLKYVAKEVQ